MRVNDFEKLRRLAHGDAHEKAAVYLAALDRIEAEHQYLNGKWDDAEDRCPQCGTGVKASPYVRRAEAEVERLRGELVEASAEIVQGVAEVERLQDTADDLHGRLILSEAEVERVKKVLTKELTDALAQRDEARAEVERLRAQRDAANAAVEKLTKALERVTGQALDTESHP